MPADGHMNLAALERDGTSPEVCAHDSPRLVTGQRLILE
jgi:hypothetical protein